MLDEQRGNDGPLELSYSRLNVFQSCPRQYHYRYVLNLDAEPVNRALLSYGRVLHAAVAEHGDRRRRPQDAPRVAGAL